MERLVIFFDKCKNIYLSRSKNTWVKFNYLFINGTVSLHKWTLMVVGISLSI